MNENSEVIILGAGASAHFGVPTMERFIDVADDLRATLKGDVTSQHFDLFFDALRERFRRLHAKSAVDLDNIESVFGLVEMARLLGHVPGFGPLEVETLAGAIRTVLVETIIHSGLFQRSQSNGIEPSPHYLGLIRRLLGNGPSKDQHAILTFNYDIGLDFALHWESVGVDYGLDHSEKHRRILRQSHSNILSVHKLHGSLNWIRCKVCGAIRVVPWEGVFRNILAAHPSTRNRTASPIDPRRGHAALGPHCPGDEQPFQVALVPPSWNKTQHASGIQNVWARASGALARARVITIVGYSLPDSDSFFRDLLALGMEGQNSIRQFSVVNPDVRIEAKFKDLLGPETRGRFQFEAKTFEQWVASMAEYPSA